MEGALGHSQEELEQLLAAAVSDKELSDSDLMHVGTPSHTHTSSISSLLASFSASRSYKQSRTVAKIASMAL